MEKKQTQTGKTTQVREKNQEPQEYLVILHNDEVTTMDFVVMVLKKFFRKSEQEAIQIMLEVHIKGKGVAGKYPYDIAVTRTHKALALAKEQGFPFRMIVEEA